MLFNQHYIFKREAPNLNLLLWLKNKIGDEAPKFWIDGEEKDQDQTVLQSDQNQKKDKKING